MATFLWKEVPCFENLQIACVNYLNWPGNCCQRSAFLWLLPCHGLFSSAIEWVKRFVNVHLHCILSNLKDKQNVDVLLLEKCLRTPKSPAFWSYKRCAHCPTLLVAFQIKRYLLGKALFVIRQHTILAIPVGSSGNRKLNFIIVNCDWYMFR